MTLLRINFFADIVLDLGKDTVRRMENFFVGQTMFSYESAYRKVAKNEISLFPERRCHL